VVPPSMLNNFSGLTELRRVAFCFNEWDESYVKPFLQCLSSLVSLEYLEIDGPKKACDFSCSPCGRLIIPTGPQQLQKILMIHITVHTVPKWMSALCSLSILHIRLLMLGAYHPFQIFIYIYKEVKSWSSAMLIHSRL